ncbi:helix-turn-helix domain-containing protein [Evansella tamaricis]|uniref:DNA-binding response regulator n=1 Tax=Evansella tamaricis TaxID=2069301 RepID=A0ABS6JE30_9BACI|nr:helix-turn-helix domain-containing protein [Evansella tamaricis]MBU9711429.1 DNA-binding response regulator [Evansella tamaricis]
MELTILIADRDKAEVDGVEWFIKHSSIPFETIYKTYNEEDTLQLIQQRRPTINLIELQMIQNHSIFPLLELTENTEMQIICTSTEATYEQAMKVIQLGAVDLVLKPHTPTRLLSSIKKAYKKLEIFPLIRTQHVNQSIETPNQKLKEPISYEQLFHQDLSISLPTQVLAFIPEEKECLLKLKKKVDTFFKTKVIETFLFSNMIVCFKRPSSHFTLKEEAKLFLNQWNVVLEPLSVILHSTSATEKTVHTLYEELKEMTEMIFYHGKRSILSYERPLSWKKVDPFLTSHEQRKWIDMLNQQDLSKIKEELYDSFLNLSSPYPYPNSIRTKMTSILAQVRRYMQVYRCGLEDSFESMYYAILEQPVLYGIVQDLVLFIQQVFEEVRVKEEHFHYDAAEQAIRFLERNYWNPGISLESVARSVNRNPSYLSHLFRQKTGHTYRQSLLDIRLKEGKRLLTETSLPIQEIASLCGFEESTYFSRCFHRNLGMSPRKYRLDHNSIKGEKKHED